MIEFKKSYFPKRKPKEPKPQVPLPVEHNDNTTSPTSEAELVQPPAVGGALEQQTTYVRTSDKEIVGGRVLPQIPKY